ncbi:MAG TPA: helix-turn-helix transcriptional regulator [Solirubrobacteraceae bacterium]|nr:helix-turn-helix transcriptional regulator [Solirubrobacteraceae bacterium]HUA74348.1 helix-turn-helix transcriptional regulator [Solirubrobacteraceae bacterium]
MNEAQATRLGRMLAQARRNKALSLRAVAERANVAYVWLYRVERGLFNDPAPERLMRVVEVLGLDPERVNRVSKGHVSSSLPEMRTYFRSKYDLSQAEIDEIERAVAEIHRKHERRKA